MDLGLADRVCAVTGASRGIGRATARMLAAEGASVLLVARGAEGLAEAEEECRGAARDGARVETLALDVTDPDAGARVVAECERRLGRLDVLVNNAGTARVRRLEDIPEEDWYAAWELNVMAPMRLMRAALPAMVERSETLRGQCSASCHRRIPSTRGHLVPPATVHVYRSSLASRTPVTAS